MSQMVAVLDMGYNFISMCTLHKAMKNIVKGKVEVVKHADETISCFSAIYRIPLVVRLIKAIRMAYKKEVAYSKKAVFIRDKFICVYCKAKTKKPTLDHIIPQCKGGRSTWENTVCACHTCNQTKGDKTLKEVGFTLSFKPFQPTIGEFMQIRIAQLGVGDILKDLWS